jgi:hypothetical protein
MSEADGDSDGAEASERDTRLGFGFLWVVTSLLMVYVLSIGPVLKFCESPASPRPTPAIRLVYKPLDTLYNSSPTAKRFFDWYIREVWKAY